MNSISADEKLVFVAKMLSRWSKSSQPRVSMEKELYAEFFHFLRPVHTVHNRETGEICFLLFDREPMIEQIKNYYSFKEPGEFDAR